MTSERGEKMYKPPSPEEMKILAEISHLISPNPPLVPFPVNIWNQLLYRHPCYRSDAEKYVVAWVDILRKGYKYLCGLYPSDQQRFREIYINKVRELYVRFFPESIFGPMPEVSLPD